MGDAGRPGRPALIDPGAYPGLTPTSAVVLVDGRVRTLRPARTRGPGRWHLDAGEQRGPARHPDAVAAPPAGGPSCLDDVLADAGLAATGDRVPVLAVGSNASPAQLHRKFSAAAVSTTVPIVPVTVRDLGIGHSAHVSPAGYVPAAPHLHRGATARVHLLWLDARQVRALDATEPNYRSVVLGRRHAARLSTGVSVTRCRLYVSRHRLLAPDGDVLPLTAQHRLLRRLARHADVAEVLGDVRGSDHLAADGILRQRLSAALGRVRGRPHRLACRV
ncbi:hypothetical protein [Egicoccus sp. AB-alg2]|uniref:hypothetical protein n=1 Tax=Egicoccus sp. AB-alg2 TaxID=3242693 RepID=UPI00359E3C64